MNSIESNFVPYQIALDMKSIGFDEPCFGYFIGLGDNKETPYKFMFIQTSEEQFEGADNAFHRPLYQQAFRWLYQKLDIEKGVMPLDTESQQLLLKELIEIVKQQSHE